MSRRWSGGSDLLRPAADDTLQEWLVSSRVNSSSYQDAVGVEAVG